MKRIIVALAAALICTSAFATDYVDSSVPGTMLVPATGPYSDTVAINVVDLVGRTNTQATISVSGSYRTQSGSGRGGGYVSVTYTVTVSSASLSVLNADGTTSPATDSSGNPITLTDTPVVNTRGFPVDHWLASAPVPVGTYSLSVSGIEKCTLRGSPCGGGAPYYVSVTETSDALPVIYWWTSAISDVASSPPLNLQLAPINISTYPGDTTGPQQVCDLYDGQLWYHTQLFYESVSPGQFQVDSVTATSLPLTDSTGSCAYLIQYQDLVNNPGVEVPVQLPDGLVSYASGPQPHVFAVED